MYTKLRFKTLIAVAAILAVVSFVGCGGGKELNEISGSVTLDGEPVKEGSIQFLPTGEGTPEGANIVDGKYTAKVSPGSSKVKITAMKAHPTEKTPSIEPGEPDVPKMIEAVPAKYNTETTLTVEVAKDGETHDFTLTTE